MPVTTPSPSWAWTTSSPMRKTWPARRRAPARASARRGRGARPRRDPAGREGRRRRAAAWSVSSRGISSRKRERTPNEFGAERVAAAGVGEREVAHRAGDADVGEPALLLDAALVDRARVREHAVLHADDEDDRELEALGVVQRHQRHEALVVARCCPRRRAARSAAGTPRASRPRVRWRRTRAPTLHELLEVLDPALRLDRPLGLERLEVAGLVQHLLEQLADGRAAVRALLQPLHRRHEAVERLARRRAERGDVVGLARPRPTPGCPSCPRGRARATATSARARACGELAIRVNAPASCGLTRNVRYVDRVLDLGAVVELRAADHLVADLRPHEHVLEHPRLRVGPVEDGDLARARRPRRPAAGSRPRRTAPRRARRPAPGPGSGRPRRRPSTAPWSCARGCGRRPRSRRRGSSASSGSSAPASRRGRRGSRPRTRGCS